MNKIIIDIKGLITEEEAVKCVLEVIKAGRISEAGKKRVQHYCFVTIFGKRIVIEARRKKTNYSTDSFIVYDKLAS